MHSQKVSKLRFPLCGLSGCCVVARPAPHICSRLCLCVGDRSICGGLISSSVMHRRIEFAKRETKRLCVRKWLNSFRAFWGPNTMWEHPSDFDGKLPLRWSPVSRSSRSKSLWRERSRLSRTKIILCSKHAKNPLVSNFFCIKNFHKRTFCRGRRRRHELLEKSERGFDVFALEVPAQEFRDARPSQTRQSAVSLMPNAVALREQGEHAKGVCFGNFGRGQESHQNCFLLGQSAAARRRLRRGAFWGRGSLRFRLDAERRGILSDWPKCIWIYKKCGQELKLENHLELNSLPQKGSEPLGVDSSCRTLRGALVKALYWPSKTKRRI